MIRIGTQLTFCSPLKILRRTVVELNGQNVVSRLFCLDDGNVEASNTLFLDGVLSSGVISLKQNMPVDDASDLLMDYHYLDLSESFPSSEIVRTKKPLIIDFGTNSPDKINNLLARLVPVLSSFSVFEIIAACTYYPALFLGWPAGLSEMNCSSLFLWENVDLVNKKLLADACVREIKE
jgi:hypothetical protein